MRSEQHHGRGILSRLCRDRRGNTLAITAAMIFPLAGLVGGGLDMGRLYIAKTRLQHACDAGALAGRKAMGSGTWSQSNNMPTTVANEFFDGNFRSTSYGSDTLTRSFTEQAGKVSGAASVRMPMTLMKIFGRPTMTLAVTCDADMRLPNTDVMFVLDVTGSMQYKAVDTDSETKIEGLRTAVRCFYEIVARLDTKATCAAGVPAGGTGNQVQIRFGFVPYASNVNVGKLLPSSYFANSWTYQSRSYVKQDWNDWHYYGQENRPGNTCRAAYDSTSTIQYRYARREGDTCIYESREMSAWWNYAPTSIPLGDLKNGSGWKSNSQFQLRIGNNGAMRTITWNGCIEERQTVRASSYSPRPANALDLDIDLVPSQSDARTLWAPALEQVIYGRRMTGNNTARLDPSTIQTYENYNNSADENCPAAASKLTKWSSATEFDKYVDTLQPTGNTYHDIGMIWGARLLSPTGIFASENAKSESGGDIQRHLIFMTDGDAVAQSCDYTAYGLAFFDQRTTTDVGPADQCANVSGGRPALNNQVNARLEALCTAVKNMNISLWVVSFGSGSNTDTEARLERCATQGRYFAARNSATLQATFKKIADQISQLRLTS